MLSSSSIQTLRTIATILVIGLHVTNDGQIATAHAFYEWLNRSLMHIRMPLFTVISGYLFAIKTIENGQYTRFAKGKARRLLIPLICVASLEYLAKAIQSGEALQALAELPLNILVLPYEHYWFIQSVFIAILVTGALDRQRMLNTPTSWLICFSTSLVFYFSMRGVDIRYFGIQGASYLLPYFLFGVALKRFSEISQSKWLSIAMLMTLLAGITVQQLGLAGQVRVDMNPRTLLGLSIGISSCFILFRLQPDTKLLATLGKYSFAVYLFQGFTTPIARIFASAIKIESHAYFIFVVTLSVAIGILAEIMITKTKFLRLPLLGVK